MSSMKVRAFLAVSLLVGFYGIAIVIAAGLIFVPYAEYVFLGRLHFQIAVFCVLGAVLIIISIFPRWERFVAPGPMLFPEDNKELFKILNDTAWLTNQKMPSAVYLVSDLNASVFEHGGFLGSGSRRVMILGLPLFQMLNVSELRAVISHEFGHYYSGDTKLGPWVYKTRSALGRTVISLSRHSNLLQKPFMWYSKFFLRISHGVSRHQEYVADGLAAELAGKNATVSALEKRQTGSIAFPSYWAAEVLPVLNRGFRPAIAQGFSLYLASAVVEKMLKQKMDEQTTASASPYDTHPPLNKRLEALSRLEADDSRIIEDVPAISLLKDIDWLELRLLSALSGDAEADKLKTIEWADVGREVWAPVWREFARQRSNVFNQITPDMFPQIFTTPLTFLKQLPNTEHPETLSEEKQNQAMVRALGAALTAGMAREGWRISTIPGEEVALYKNGYSFSPFASIANLQSKAISAQEWFELCEKYGIASINLGGS